jgi:Glycosyl hydrolase family 81 C-terminal domain
MNPLIQLRTRAWGRQHSVRFFPMRIALLKSCMRFGCLVTILVTIAAAVWSATVESNGPVSILRGNDKINPQPGTQGAGTQFNSLFYIRPGEGEGRVACPTPTPPPPCIPSATCGPCVQQFPHQPYYRAYESATQPVQSNDWWVAAGLQWYVPQTNIGWVNGFNPANNKPRTRGFLSEPFAYDFVDFPPPPLPEAPYGLRLWNQNAIAIKTDGKEEPEDPFNPTKNIIDRGFLQPENQPVVTVGLENVHPLSQYLNPNPPQQPPWTNVLVRRYSDWGLVLAYANNGSEMEITMANGSPFTWLERTQGQANFLVWTGGRGANTQPPHIWKNDSVGQLAVLGVTVETVFGADNNIGQINSKAAYLVIADQGTWVPEPSPIPEPTPRELVFRNTTATKVVVLAMPHDRLDDASLQRAATELLPFACRKIVDTRIDYPPIPQSTPSVIVGNETVTLGYNPTAHRVALQLRLETAPFLPGNCAASEPVQLLFPHHLKSLHPGQRAKVNSTFVWHSIKGPLKLYRGSSFVQLIGTKGYLPFLPDVVAESDLKNPLQPSQPAVEDIYETMRNWFYLEEFQTGGNHINSFVHNIGTYDNVQENTYEQKFTALIESLMIADQLAKSRLLREEDKSESLFDSQINLFTVNTSTNLITVLSPHGLRAGDQVRFSTTGTLPAPLDPNRRYFVLADGLTNTQLKVSLTANGTAIDFTSIGNGEQTIKKTLHACLCKPKTEVAAEMRDYILQALKELAGQWADVYTAQFMQYNPDFKTTYGFPAGFGSVQNLSDHHFHFGYFLRAAAAIGRYDRDWLNGYLPFFDRLRRDVANYDRTDTTHPFFRNFSLLYGHNWADGTGQDGANQESTSEAMNFSAALIDLGLLLGNNEWRDIGMYMYEQEILAAEQYWFNQDATLPTTVPRPPTDPNDVRYNGNWPEQFVTFQGPAERGGGVWHTTLGGRVHQRFIDRATFFGGIAETYFIQMIPMSASTLYFGRNQTWLNATWHQYLLDTDAERNPSFQSGNETFMAAWQALMPSSGQGINGTGLNAALERIARPHAFQAYGTNTMAKYWAYTNHLLGQVDTTVVADIPAYGAFRNAGSGHTLVAYNPTDQEIEANFSGGGVSESLHVPARSIASKSSGGGRGTEFKPNQITIPRARLYLGATSPTPSPGVSPSPLPLRGQLCHTPGTWLPANETYEFPNSCPDPLPNGDCLSRIMPSLSIIPVSTGNCSDIDLPGVGGGAPCMNGNKAYAEWTGTFSGEHVGFRPSTQMTIYTNPALHPGWQQDPTIRSTTNVRIEYYFDAAGQTPDRVEVYTGSPSQTGNTFVINDNKITSYYYGGYWCIERAFGTPLCNDSQSGLYGLDAGARRVTLDNRFAEAKAFPDRVTCGRIKVQVYGQTGNNQSVKVPVPVSVGTSPLLNRASWVQPPYDGGECQQCATLTPSP